MLTHVHKVFAGFALLIIFDAFGKMKCLFSIAPDANSWWLAHWSKGGEDRSENRADASIGPVTGRTGPTEASIRSLTVTSVFSV